MINLTIPGQPIGKQRPRIARAGRKSFMYAPTKTVSYENYVKELFTIRYGSDFQPLQGPVQIKLKAFMKMPKASIKKTEAMISGEILPTKKPDASNLLKIIEDALNSVAYADDKQIIRATVEKRYSTRPRVELIIEEIKQGGKLK